MSRIAGGEHLLGPAEKEAFRLLLWQMSEFHGVEVLTFCVMSNHFHLLVKVPPRKAFMKKFEDPPGHVGGARPGERALIEHLGILYADTYIERLQEELRASRAAGRPDEARAALDRYRNRLCNLSVFMKELKERFSRWFNKTHDRTGTLWMDRFRSVVVEDGDCLRTMAAYIDLNPVRAGIVAHPQDYRWCGYAEAIAGSTRMRRGICEIVSVPPDAWSAPAAKSRSSGVRSGSRAYAELLDQRERRKAAQRAAAHRSAPPEAAPAGGKRRQCVTPGEKPAPTHPAAPAPTAESLSRAIARGEKVDRAELLTVRCLWLTRSHALGSKGFVRKIASHNSNSRRRHGADRVTELPIAAAGEGGGGETRWFGLTRLRAAAVG